MPRLRRLAAGCLIAVGIAACGPVGLPPDVLVVGQTAEPRALDPHVTTSQNDFRILGNLFEGLVRFDGALDIRPALATRWEVLDGGTRYRFHLRRGVRFHDGTPFDAEAVRFNLERMLDEHHPQHATGPFPLAFFFDPVREVRVVDGHTVELLLRRPFAPLLANLAYPIGFMVSPAAVRHYGRDFRRHPVGTGPFRFVAWKAHERVVLERNPDYWGGAPALRRVIFRPLDDPAARLTALVTGEVDVLAEVSADAAGALRDSSHFVVYHAEGPHLWFLILNMRHGPFADRRVRRAANLAVDRRALVEHVLQGTARTAVGPVPRAFAWAYDASLPAWPYDPERARELLREAGHPDGVDVRLLAPQSGSGMLAPVEMATAIQADWARVGIHAEIQTSEWNSYLARVNRGLDDDADAAEMAWMTNDPDTLLYLALRSGAWPKRGGFDSGYYANPRVDEWIERARRTPDRDERARLYRRVQRAVREDAPWVVVASWRQALVASHDVEGLGAEPSFLLHLAGVHKRSARDEVAP